MPSTQRCGGVGSIGSVPAWFFHSSEPPHATKPILKSIRLLMWVAWRSCVERGNIFWSNGEGKRWTFITPKLRVSQASLGLASNISRWWLKLTIFLRQADATNCWSHSSHSCCIQSSTWPKPSWLQGNCKYSVWKSDHPIWVSVPQHRWHHQTSLMWTSSGWWWWWTSSWKFWATSNARATGGLGCASNVSPKSCWDV